MTNKWVNITVEQYIEIEQVKKENTNLIDKIIYLNHILGIRDMYDDIYDEYTITDFKKELENISFIKTQPPIIKPDNAISVSKSDFGLYIDTFEYLNNEKYIEFLNRVECENNVCFLMWYIDDFNKFYNTLREKYSNIYPKTKTEYIDTSTIKNRKERFQLEQEQNKAKRQEKFSWLNILYVLSDGDLTKYETIINTNTVLVHNWLSLMILKNNNQI